MRDGAEVARRAHNPKVVGSNPAPATENKMCHQRCLIHLFFITIGYYAERIVEVNHIYPFRFFSDKYHLLVV